MQSILFIHENFPAQFGGLAVYLARRGWRVVFATAAPHVAPDGKDHVLLPGVHVVGYRAARAASAEGHAYLKSTETAVLNAQAFARVGAALAKGGFAPDVIVAHSGWGSGSLAKVVWPEAKFVQYLEWWYSDEPVDVPETERAANREDFAAKAYCRNLPFLLDAQIADAILVPTKFQAARVPDWLRPRLHVLHDGVDSAIFAPAAPGAPGFDLGGLPAEARIVTYATRGMEPMRGFPQFMAAWARVQHVWPEAHCVVAGSDRTCYGPKPGGTMTHKTASLRLHAFDPARLHFCGLLPKARYRSLLQRSAAHVYLTRPFVLSWSCIEAMMTGTPLVVSDTAPVREAVPEGAARFVGLDDVDGLVAQVGALLAAPEQARAQGLRARSHALQTYDTSLLHPRHEALLLDLIGARAALSQSA